MPGCWRTIPASSASATASLYKGRILHLKGRFFDEKGAIAYYQKARPRTRDVLAQEAKQAEAYYTALKKQAEAKHALTAEVDRLIKQQTAGIISMEYKVKRLSKIDAAYWLGLIEYEQEQYDSAIEYFTVRTLQGEGYEKPWGAGAVYNIGRCLEMSGQWIEAARQYELSFYLKDEDGYQLRARWLREVHAGKPPKKKKPAAEKKH